MEQIQEEIEIKRIRSSRGSLEQAPERRKILRKEICEGTMWISRVNTEPVRKGNIKALQSMVVISRPQRTIMIKQGGNRRDVVFCIIVSLDLKLEFNS